MKTFHEKSRENYNRIADDYDNTFNVITVCAAYHHFADVKAVAKEANRLLKPNGLLFIADVYYSLFKFLANLILPFSDAGDVRCYSPKEIQANFEAYGFKPIGFKKRGVIQIVIMQKTG